MVAGPAEAVMAVAFFGAIAVTGVSIANVWIKRIGSRSEAVPDRALAQQLARIETAVEAMAVEIERISEAQRFSARLAAESQAARLAPPGRAPEGRVITPH